jgi:ABC-type transport system substrate-binding protein/DNA-binding SARP family transcriptional activator
MASTVKLRVFLAGRVAVEADGVVLDEGRLAGRQGRLVFAYLVAERGRPVPRDELAEALWGSAPPATWDKALTVIASKLRTGLADVGVDGGTALTSAFGCYRLELPEGSWVDVNVAADAADAAEQALAAGQLETARDGAASAVESLRQPFLPGEAGEWVEAKRRELADVQGRTLNVLAEACLRLGEAPEAAKWAEQAIALEPFRETGYRRLMEAHAAAGNRAEALQVYERCRRLLADELGAYPSPETESIYRQLLAAPAPPDDESAPAPDAEMEPAPPVRRRRGRTLLIGALAGVIAAAVAVPLFAFSSDESRATQPDVTLAGNAVGAVSASTGQIFARVPLSASPVAITAGAGSIWVAMSERGIVSRINEKTNTVQQTITTRGGPSALAVGAGFVWVADTPDGTVSRIDPRANGGQIVGNPIRVGNAPSGIAYGLRAVWVANSIDSTVMRIDPVTGTAGPPISVEGGADGIAVGDDSVWVIGQSDGVLSRIDPVARTVAGTTSINEPAAVAVGPGAVWVASAADGTVTKIDPSSGHPEGSFPAGKQPSGVAVGPDGHVWVASAGSAMLTELDPVTGQSIRAVSTGAPPSGVALDGETAYVAAQVPPSAHRGGTLTVAIANRPGQYSQPIPKSLDPASGYSAWELLTLTNDGLLAYSQAGGSEIYKVVPDLATALPTISNGGLTYTFQLRKGIHYSTGEVVEPADIRRGIERALLQSGDEFPKLAPYLDVIVGGRGCATGGHCDLTRGITTSPGSNTVTFHLSKPDPDFLLKLALPPYDAVPASTPLDARLPLPATGPYMIAGWRRKGVVVLIRNPRFRVWSTEAQPQGYPDKIVERYRYSGAEAIHAVERGTADITTNGFDQTWPPALAASLQTRYSSRLYPQPELSILGLWLNTRLAPFNDVRVRQAFNLAVDRNRLAQINGGAVACQFIPPSMNGYSYYCPYNGPNLTKARRLVAESGTKGQSITIWIYDIPAGHRNAAYLIPVLRSIGYKARVAYVPHDTRPTWGPGRQAGVQGWGAGDYPSTNNVFLAFLCSSITTNPKTNGNYAGLCDRRLDAQVARAVSLETTNPAAAADAWHSADRMLSDQAPWLPLKRFLSIDFVARRVGNYRYCWLSGGSGLTGACLGQLWVR